MATTDRKTLLIQRAARLTAQGLPKSAIADKLGVAQRTLSRYQDTEIFNEELEKVSTTERHSIAAMLTAGMAKAVRTLVNELKNKDARHRIAAAKAIADKYSSLPETQKSETLHPPAGIQLNGILYDFANNRVYGKAEDYDEIQQRLKTSKTAPYDN